MNDAVKSSFVPAGFDPSDFANIEPLVKKLLDRPLESVEAVRRWVVDASDLFAAVSEYGARKNIDNACHTEDEQKERAYLHYIREIYPKLKPAMFELQKKLLACPHISEMTDPGEQVMLRHWRQDVERFRPENVPLQTRDTELGTEYGKICGAMVVEFQGKQYTLQQMARFLEETDRDTRRNAWITVAERRLADRERIESIFEQMLALRHEMARNADCADYRQYMWKAKYRFDYTPQDCLTFGDSIARHCMPLLRELDEDRKAALGVDRYRPWDREVDALGRAPLRPFDPANVDAFVDGAKAIFAKLSPKLGDQFETLRTNGNLDLDSRKGKRPGGFQSSLERSRQPFIFMNAAGLQNDVDTLLHEGGHAFHYQANCHIPNLFVRHAPLEFCEVASMSMELLGCDHYGAYYDDEAQAIRAKRQQLESSIRVLPWVATIDGFQHWLYTHPGHSRDERAGAWRGLLDRFETGVVDYSGYEHVRESMWHRQLHLFQVPFYYIEYGIAQLGALQVWCNYRRDPQQAMRQLWEAFSLGGTRPLPRLFDAAGIRFDFTEATLRPLIEEVRNELMALPV